MRTKGTLSSQQRLRDAWITVPCTSTLLLNARIGCHFRVTLDRNVTFDPPYDGHPGQEIILRITQDGTGSRTVTVNSAINSRGSIILSSAANSVTLWRMTWDEDGQAWDLWGAQDLSSVYQPLNAGLTLISAATVTSAGVALLDDANAAAQRTTLGLGSAFASNIMSAQADSAAATLAALVADFNALLAKLRASGNMTP